MSVHSASRASDLHDEAFARDPFPVWERLRHEAPPFHDTVDDVYLLTRYEDVVAVPRDDATSSQYHLTVQCPRATLIQGGSS